MSKKGRINGQVYTHTKSKTRADNVKGAGRANDWLSVAGDKRSVRATQWCADAAQIATKSLGWRHRRGRAEVWTMRRQSPQVALITAVSTGIYQMIEVPTYRSTV